MNSKVIFQLDRIAKSYVDGTHRTEVLTDVTVQVGRGELLGISGPSGSGKTTLLNIMSLLDGFDSGRLFFMDEDLSLLSAKERCRFRLCRIGMVFQRFHLMTGFSVIENVMLPNWRLTGDKGTARKHAKALLERFALSHRMHYLVEKLSGGERQRTALARAVINNPDVILADEPTGQLGAEQTADIIRLFREVSSEGKTVVVVSHNMEVLAHTDRAVHLKNGVLTSVESADDPQDTTRKVSL
jgi:ABC-type lipoprotein export system ATPase subunit